MRRQMRIVWVAVGLAGLSGSCGFDDTSGDSPRAASGPTASATSRPVFDERATALGLDFVHFNGMSGEYYFCEIVGPGAALLDYDGDGDLDAYLVQGNALHPDASTVPNDD